MGVQNLEGHPVPVAQWNLARFALVKTYNDNFSAHTGSITYQIKRRLSPDDFEGGVGSLSVCQRFYGFRQRLLSRIDHMRGPQSQGALKRICSSISNDQATRSL